MLVHVVLFGAINPITVLIKIFYCTIHSSLKLKIQIKIQLKIHLKIQSKYKNLSHTSNFSNLPEVKLDKSAKLLSSL